MGANDELPEVEIYDGKHVCAATGEHVLGTPLEIREWDDEALEAVLDEHDQLPTHDPHEDVGSEYEAFDADEYDASVTSADETTDDIRDLFAALDRIDARNVAGDTIAHRWNDAASTSEEKRAFVPTFGKSANGTANIVGPNIWQDTGGGGYGGPVVMALIDLGELRPQSATPRDARGELWFKGVDHLRDLGYPIPELESPDRTEEYDDPREVDATVDPRRAWNAAGRVTPDDLDDDALPTTDDGTVFACPDCGDSIDVVRAVALAEGVVDSCDESLEEAYPDAYTRAREAYDAPLPRYYTTADAVAEFDAILSLIGEATFWHLNADRMSSEVTGEGSDVSGDAVRTLDPAWRDSESGESVLVFDNGTIWDADTEKTLDVLRFVALDDGLIDDPTDTLGGGMFTEAYRLARREYGVPLPQWEPARDGERTATPMLPPAGEFIDDPDGLTVHSDRLEEARASVEALLRTATADDGQPTIVRALPATGKTTGTVKVALERPESYLAPRKELQAQALEKAERWGVDAQVLPVFSDRQMRDEPLAAAVSHVRDLGKDRLRERWAVYNAAMNGDEEDEDGETTLFEEKDDDEVELDRATCATAEGKHGKAWALVVHVARRLGYTPQEIHTQAHGLFGADLPCTCGEDDEEARCPYSEAWSDVANPDDPADLLVGSYVHAHVESVRTAYSRAPDGEIDRAPRTVVLDEFPGEAYTREFGEEALDFATWLASALQEDVADRRDMLQADLCGDEWVQKWLNGNGDDHDAVGGAITALAREGDLLDARSEAAEILDEVDRELLESFDLAEPLGEFVSQASTASEAYETLRTAVDVDPEQPGAGVASWVEDEVVVPLADAAVADRMAVSEAFDVADLPVGGELQDLVADALEAAETDADRARGAIEAAVTALRGGPEGCRRLAAWGTDGYAHPNAHRLLRAIVTPEESDNATRGATAEWAFDPDATEGTVLDVVKTGDRATTVVDRNDHGALLHTPPQRTAAGGADVPLVGLDATGRAPLWGNALGEEVQMADIHDTDAERAEFLKEALGLHVIQASDRPRPYEGDPQSKDLDGDVALLEWLKEDYSGLQASRERGEEASTVGSPACLTTKGVRNVLEDDERLEDVVAEWENYGNHTGDNTLGAHRLAAVLGSQHYGDAAIERFCALGGEFGLDTSRDTGRGAELSYANDLADEYLAHMRDDQVMQGVLRFARGDSGATVVCRTSALRDDLPVVGRGQVATTWNDTATAIARQWRRLGGEFTAADVADVVDVSKRQVRRVLAEFVDVGYITHVGGGDGTAKVYSPSGTPGAGEVDLPDVGEAVTPSQAGRDATNEYYTWNVRVGPPSETAAGGRTPPPTRRPGAPPSPTAVDGVEPPD